MPRNRVRDRLDRRNTLNTIPHQNNVLIQLNKGVSKADTRHDLPLPITNYFLTVVLNLVYGAQIEIRPGDVYQDYAPGRDIFTMSVKEQVRLYQLSQGVYRIDANPFNTALNGPIPKFDSIKYFMRTLDTGRDLLVDEGETKVVVVSDNASLASVHRKISEKTTQIFLHKVNSAPDPVNISETTTLSTVVDMAGKSVPHNWAQLFHTWWDDCVDVGLNSFSIDLTAIGAVNIGGTELIIQRSTQQERVVNTNLLKVGIVVNNRVPLNIEYNLNEPSLEQSIMRHETGEYVFVSGKNIASVFFEEYNNFLMNPRGLHNERVIHHVARAVASATGLRYDDALRHVTSIFNTCDDYEIIGIYFIIGKLIGDLLCPLCCDNKWYTLTNDNLLIARCLLLYKRALFYKKNNFFTGFYFFVPEEPQAPAVVERNQLLTNRIQEDKLSIKKLELLVKKTIRTINNSLDRKIKDYREPNNELKIIKMHKYFCELQLRDVFLKFSKGEITTTAATDEIKRISGLTVTEKNHRDLLRTLIRDLGEEPRGGAPSLTPTTITIKWKKQVENVTIHLSDPVAELKVQLFSLTGVAPDKQKIIMGGKTLKDELSLESFGVKHGSVLQMMGNASETWVKPDMQVKFVDDLPASEQATDNNPSESVLNICGGYARCVTNVFESDIENIKKILSSTEPRKIIFGIGNQPITVIPPKAEKFIQSLKLFLEKVITKIGSKDELYMLQIFGHVISHLEDILSINASIIFQSNDDIVIPFCIDYDKVSHACLLLGINIEDFTIEGESFESQFNNFKELFTDDTERILPVADIPTIVRNLVTSILEKIKNNEDILKEASPLDDIYKLLKGEDLETILSSNKDNINDLYFNAIPEVLGIMHSYGVFTQAEEVELYIIQAIIENKNKDSREHEIITKSVYSLYQNISGLYGIYVYDTEILKTFIQNIKLQNNMIQYDGGFNSLQTIIDYRCDIEFETIIKDTYVSLNQFMQQQEQQIKELEQPDKPILDTERLHALDLHKITQSHQLKHSQTVGVGGKNNRISNPNPKQNTKYRKNYKKFVSKYIIKKKKNNNKNNNKKNNKNNKNKTRKNKRLTKSTPNSKRNNKTLKNKKRKTKPNKHKSKQNNKKTKTNYYNSYKHNKTLKH